MMDHIELDSLYPLQAELDEEIQRLHGVSYASTHEKRLLALLVEFGEFANETRCFKFWSLKGPSEKAVILDEFADGMHFFLSLGIPLGVTSLRVELPESSGDLTHAILETYEKAVALKEHYDQEHYVDAFSSYLRILPLLGFKGQEAIDAYHAKLKVNHKRQETHY